MSDIGRLPDFVIAGAPRSGTTSLARYLDAHPDLYIAPGKELRFFDDNYDKGLSWYSSCFDGAPEGALAGEGSPLYMFSDLAVQRMATDIPNAHIIASLREPRSRLWSHYWMRRERGLETKPFEAVIDAEIELFESHGVGANDIFYLRSSLYAPALRRLLESYDRNKLSIVVFERLATDPGAVVTEIFTSLGVDPSILPENLGDKVNSYTQFRSLKVREMTQRSNSPLLTRILGRLNTRRDTEYPDMPDDYRRRLGSIFEPERLAVETIVGSAIPEWADGTD